MTAVWRGSNRIKVSFAPGIGWGVQTEYTRRVFRRSTPPEQYFEQEDKLVMLGAFEIVTTIF